MNKYQIIGRLYTIAQSRTGIETIRRIWVNGIEILPEMGCGLRPFYECGFSWGKTGGNLSYTTALTICLSIFREERLAENLFVCFKEDFVQYFPEGNFDLSIDLSAFLIKYQLRLQPDLYSFFCFSCLINSREILVYKNPLSGQVTADLSENYAMHILMITDEKTRKLNERRHRLIFRFLSRESYIVKGDDVDTVLQKVESIMSTFFWKSLERVLRAKYTGR
ncbi:MAG: hypothetical protein ABWY16_08760 [Pedobacter sp.]|uniref:hypothetical protein n=1 Tax=Pedobacter sp. TaxID=1411316 RepID=UPI0033926F1C